MVTSLGWTPSNNELFTVSDDKTVMKWNMDGETADKICEIDSFVTDLKWQVPVRVECACAFVC